MVNECILLIDDHDTEHNILKKMLSEQYSVIEAENGQAALQILWNRENKIACILLDLYMPVMSGLDFLQELSKLRKSESLPVIIITSEEDVKQEWECLRIGAWDLIHKPVNPEFLRLLLSHVVAQSMTKQMRKLKHIAKHDVLTGLYNRQHFICCVTDVKAQKDCTGYVMVHFDIKKFHLFNLLFGTDAGDTLLQRIANSLQEEIA